MTATQASGDFGQSAFTDRFRAQTARHWLGAATTWLNRMRHRHHELIAKLVVSVAVVFGSSIAAIPAVADPIAFSDLSSRCGRVAPANSAVDRQEIDRGLHDGLYAPSTERQSPPCPGSS